MTFGKWLLEFFLIAAGLGALAFFGGEKLPRRWFRPDAFPYRQAAWEQNGAVYEEGGIFARSRTRARADSGNVLGRSGALGADCAEPAFSRADGAVGVDLLCAV